MTARPLTPLGFAIHGLLAGTLYFVGGLVLVIIAPGNGNPVYPRVAGGILMAVSLIFLVLGGSVMLRYCKERQLVAVAVDDVGPEAQELLIGLEEEEEGRTGQ